MASIVSVNIGRPRKVQWEGKLVETSIWKRPVDGRVLVGKLNLAGDEQADKIGHGGEHRAVMVYQLESYRYWESFLNRPSFEYGQFGENLTVEGLADTSVCVGDQYRIGTALFEVSQPRVTCFKVGIKLAHPQMPALMVAHRRPGFYFRVLEEGEIGVGDTIVKVVDGPGKMTVAEIDSLLYTRPRSRNALAEAVQIPALSKGWRDSFMTYLAEDNPDTAPIWKEGAAWKGYRPLAVVGIKKESEDVLSIVLAAPDGSRLPRPIAGQYIALQLRVAVDLPPVIRTYSLSGANDDYRYRISVRLQGGPGSGFLHRHVRVGDLMQVSSPRGAFLLEAGKRPVVLLSAGIGVTPLIAMLHALGEGDRENPREVWWVQSTRDKAHHVFAQEVEAAGSRISGFHRQIFYSRPDKEDILGSDFDFRGRADAYSLERLRLPKGADYYVCGPSSFMSDVRAALEGLAAEPSHIHEELFDGTTGKPVSGFPTHPVIATTTPLQNILANDVDVTFAKAGVTVRWDPRLGSLLELAEANSIPSKWSCRSGVCHNCECDLLEGQLTYSPEPLDEPPAGRALICCSTPTTNVRLDL
jgi:ferredoxin-NADP reductase/MOSC domain-containing protein YiiM